MKQKEILAYDGTDNILACYLQATQAEQLEGASWYIRAQGYASCLSDQHPSYSLEQIASVIAVLSPNVQWSVNCKAAEQVLQAHRLGLDANDVIIAGYPANKRKAWKILNLPPHECGYAAIDEMASGRKVNAFYHNILGYNRCVTVDRYAFSVWVGVRTVTPPTLSAKSYRHIADAYRTVAEQRNVAPSLVQAVTWLVYKRLHSLAE